ncbi:hypothetical protein G7Y89_g8530 [Cudoniella acicularis]|uniref:Uncharacterized protein n=1 Tax=Cudoniella acicularis TaxID=354080 RepID=A0A8H4RGG0_9HELO|nr:hypothetical protein G7Y89_g8530 [Cudoniella acicularis]
MDRVQATGKVRKRKAESQDNERLSKRLSLLNLGLDPLISFSKLCAILTNVFAERNGQKLYVPVEQPTITSSSKPKAPAHPKDEDVMQLDNTKHKVYIYDLDAELSDSSESDDGKLVFLPDIEKHLRESRIPPSIRANSDGELAGNKQLVLYSIPSSLTVAEEHDSVRKAIIETRARARAKQEQARSDHVPGPQTTSTSMAGPPNTRDWYQGMINGTIPKDPRYQEPMDELPNTPVTNSIMDEDLDAMDLG